MPRTPIKAPRSGPRTIETMKVIPIAIPMIAMDFVRTTSLVKSALSAITTEEIAPAPCTALPRQSTSALDASAAITLPTAKIINPT